MRPSMNGTLGPSAGALVGELMGRELRRDEGAVLRIDRLFIDLGYQRDVVRQACRQSAHASVLMSTRGAGITGSMKRISEYERNRGDRAGHHWWIPSHLVYRRILGLGLPRANDGAGNQQHGNCPSQHLHFHDSPPVHGPHGTCLT